jgi:hypothetical protein
VASLADVFRIIHGMSGRDASERTAADQGARIETESERRARVKAAWHQKQAKLPLREKFRILLELQRQDYELLKCHRALEWWEKPWEIEP